MTSVQKLAAMALKGQDGKDWYLETLPSLVMVAEGLGVTVQYLSDILAITSPRVHVRRNIRIALTYITGGGYAGVMSGVVQSLRYYEDTGIIRGPKTSAFAKALRGDGDAIVLDVWMARALNVEQSKLPTKAVKLKAEGRVAKVARQLGWTPAETQAAIWTHLVRTHRDSTGRRTYKEAPSFSALLLHQAA